MLPFVLITGTLAAVFNAASTTLQRQATGAPKKDKLYSKNFAAKVTKHPLFIVGTLFQILAAALHLLALSRGSLILVQPLLTLDLVFLVLFLHFRYKLKTGSKEWVAIGAIVVGLAALFAVADPKSGSKPYVLSHWIIIIALGILLMSVFIFITKLSDSPKKRAIFAALATSVCYGLNSGLAKLTLTGLKAHGLLQVFLNWPVYALIASALISVVLMQNAYGSGPLAVSQPILESVAPLLSSLVGIIIFGDIIRHTPYEITAELVSSALLIWGIFSLGGSQKLYIKYKSR